MKAILLSATLALAGVGMAASPAQAGCIKGAVVGAIAGHFVGHAGLGAGAGCVVGRVNSNRRDERDRAYEPNNEYQPNGVSGYQRPAPYTGDPRGYSNYDNDRYNNGYNNSNIRRGPDYR